MTFIVLAVMLVAAIVNFAVGTIATAIKGELGAALICAIATAGLTWWAVHVVNVVAEEYASRPSLPTSEVVAIAVVAIVIAVFLLVSIFSPDD